MRRREFITLLGGAAAWPMAARAQPFRLPVIGVLHPGSPVASARTIPVFERALTENDFFASRNVAIEYRWAEGQLNRLPEMARDLISRQVDVLVARSATAALAAKGAASNTQ